MRRRFVKKSSQIDGVERSLEFRIKGIRNEELSAFKRMALKINELLFRPITTAKRNVFIFIFHPMPQEINVPGV